LNLITSKYAKNPSSFVYGPAKKQKTLFVNKNLNLPSPPPSIIVAPIELL